MINISYKYVILLCLRFLCYLCAHNGVAYGKHHSNLLILGGQDGSNVGAASAFNVSSEATSHNGSSGPHHIVGNGPSGGLLPLPTNSALKVTQFYRSRLKRLLKNNLSKDNWSLSLPDYAFSKNIINNENKTIFFKPNLKNGSILSDSFNLLIRPNTLNYKYDLNSYGRPSQNVSDNDGSKPSRNSSPKYYRSNLDGFDVERRNYTRRKFNKIRPKNLRSSSYDGAINSSRSDSSDTNSVNYDKINSNLNDIQSIFNSTLGDDSESLLKKYLPEEDGDSDSPLPSTLSSSSIPGGGVARGAAIDFTHHGIITPRLLHARTKRELPDTWDTDGHANHISLGLTIGDKNVVFDLYLNRDLLTSDYFEKQLNNEIHNIRRPKPEEAGMCQYQGFIKERPGSWAAVSTCSGIRGIVFDGEELHYLEPIPDLTIGASSPHYLLNHKHYSNKNLTCGYTGKPHPVTDLFHDESFSRLLRYKREASSNGGIRGPFNANSLSRYVELILVADKTEFEKHNSDFEKIYQRCKDIANIVNALYQPLNIFIALVGVEVWNATDEVDISTDGDKTLTNFLTYRKVRLIPQHPNDNAQLLTGKVFDSGVVGKALKGPICTYQYSGGVNMDHSDSVGLVATTVAHEMGHNFGMEHDTEEDCKCPDKRCIMAPSSGTKSPSHWSSCSHEYLAISFERSMDYCLRNKPTSLFQSPVCGNGFVEPGEQCDCGLPDHCTNPCCNATSCMLFVNATCATGHCCDLDTCSPRPAGVECRSALHECDLPEFCSGDSEYCPNNFYKEDGQECMGGKAYCYEGMCRTHENQCRLLWGPTGKNSHDKCYSLNREGNPNGNCGYNWANKTYKKCNTDDIKCGMMHCKHFNERLEFGMESVSKVSHRFIADKNQGVIPCRVAQVDLGLDMVDPGLAPDGAKCGYKRMCVDQQCMEVASLRTHVCSCNGRGVCNNLGNCHCDIGFTWPDCMYPGLGGSVDSGPASNPNATSAFVAALFIIFLGVVPLFVIILCLAYFIRGNLKLWWLRKGRPATSRLSSMDGHSRNGRTQSPLRIEAVTKTAGGNSTLDGQTSTIRSDSPPSSQGSKCNSPLLNGHANGSSAKIQTQLFGKYEGFTLSPMKDKPGNGDVPLLPPLLSATRASPLSATMQGTDSTITNTTVQKGTRNVKSNLFQPNAIPPSMKSTATTKVDISNPSLQTSTNPAVGAADFVSPGQPKYLNSTAAFPRVAVVSPMRRAPNRPKSVPDASTLILNQCQMSSTLSDPTSLEDGKDQGKTSTVARIASFLSKKEKIEQPRLESSHPIIQSNTLPRKAAKINRESLLQLEISHPMQLQATELPNNLVPVRPAPDPPMPSNLKPSEIKASQDKSLLGKVSWAPTVSEEEPEQSDLLRIGSVREPSVTTRPSIPKFGSMRVPRPKSLPPARPSQPPPRPPLPMIPGTPETEYFYDDCLNPPSSGAPLAAGEEEISPQEGIYATIDEESPPRDCSPPQDKKDKKSIFSLLYAKTKKKKHHEKETSEPLYCNIENIDDVSSSSKEDSPVKYENSGERSSTSTEDGGLLSEIVSELVNREPQYVNTLNAKEKLKNSLLKETDFTSKPTKVELSLPMTKSTSFPRNQSDCQTAPKESKSSPDLARKPKISSYVPYSNVKPRGVFSFFKNTGTEETSLANSAEEKLRSKGTPQSFDETSEVNKQKEKVDLPKGKINVNASISVPSSLAASLAGVKAASKEVSDANKRTKALLDNKSTTDTKIIVNPSPANNKELNKITCTISPTSDVSISVAASYTAATEVKMASQPNIVFPPDKIIHSMDKLPSAAITKPSAAPPPSNRPSFPADKNIVNAPKGRGSGGPIVPLVGKTIGKVNPPNKGNIPSKDVVSAKSSSSDKGKTLAGSIKKPAVTAKVDSGFKGKGSSATKEKAKELSSSSLKDSTKPGVIKKIGRLPSTSSSKSPIGSVASLSRSDVLAAAAKPGPQGTSHVASLQQKFEESLQESNTAAKPATKVLKSKGVKK